MPFSIRALAALLFASGGVAAADTITLDFEDACFDLGTSSFLVLSAADLAAFGITSVTIDTGDPVAIFPEARGGNSINPGGGRFLTNPGGPPTLRVLTLQFAPDLTKLSFVRIGGTGFTSFAHGWTLEAFDEGGVSLGVQTGDPGSGIFFGTVPPVPFSVEAPAGKTISRVEIATPATGATFAVTPIDDLVMEFGSTPGGTVGPFGCGANPAGSLTVAGGAPAIGGSISFGVHNPLGTQASGSFTFLAVSISPATAGPCGNLLPGLGMAGGGAPGELLISLLPPDPVQFTTGFPWSGTPVPIDVAIPNDCKLVGVTAYVQGGLVDVSPAATVPVALTEGMALVVGP